MKYCNPNDETYRFCYPRGLLSQTGARLVPSGAQIEILKSSVLSTKTGSQSNGENEETTNTSRSQQTIVRCTHCSKIAHTSNAAFFCQKTKKVSKLQRFSIFQTAVNVGVFGKIAKLPHFLMLFEPLFGENFSQISFCSKKTRRFGLVSSLLHYAPRSRI